MLKLVTNSLVVVGVLIALFGIGIDYLLPGATPGINPPQLLLIGAGLALALHRPIIQRAKTTWLAAGARSRLLLTAALITAATLVSTGG